jgi:hypothetical protein
VKKGEAFHFTRASRYDRHTEDIMKTWTHLSILLLAVVGTACDDVVAPEAPHVEAPSLAVAQASPHTLAVGTFTQTAITSLDARPAGPNTILEQSSAGSVTGTLNGNYEDDLRVVIHPNGLFNAHFTITCACTVDGKQGVLQLVATDRGKLVGPDLATFVGRAVITDGTGELSDLRGVLAIEGTIDLQSGLATYDYSGRIH